MIKAVTFHATATRSADGFRPFVRISAQRDNGKSRMVGGKGAPFLFATESEAITFAANRAFDIAQAERAHFPATVYTVRRKADAVKPAATLAEAIAAFSAELAATVPSDLESMLATLAARDSTRRADIAALGFAGQH